MQPHYKIPTLDAVDFTLAPRAEIGYYRWTEGYAPYAYAQLLYVKGEGFALRMTAQEDAPKALYTNYDDPVYKDSCLEFFVSFNPLSKLYMNFEMNSNGAFLAAVRESRRNKTPIDQRTALPSVKADRAAHSWSVETFFPLAMIRDLFGAAEYETGTTFRGNFYKCGDETALPHFGMWSPIDLEAPDFHRPEFFGTLEIGAPVERR